MAVHRLPDAAAGNELGKSDQFKRSVVTEMAKIDLMTAPFGTVVFILRDEKPERAVVVVEGREGGGAVKRLRPGVVTGVSHRSPVLFFENPMIGRKDIVNVETVDAYTSAEEFAAASVASASSIDKPVDQVTPAPSDKKAKS